MPERVNPLHMPQDQFEAWLRENGKTIGGTAAGAILGLNPNRSPAQAWDDIMFGRVESRNNRMDRGNAMEPIIATIFAEETGRTVSGDGVTRVVDEELPFLHATIDREQRLIGPCTMPQNISRECLATPGLVEIKCLGIRTFSETKEQGVAPMYYAQFQHYLMVRRWSWGSFAIFNAEDWVLHWFDVPRDDDFIEQARLALVSFWTNHVMTRQRPGPDRSALVDVPPRVGAELVLREDPAWSEAFQRLRAAYEDKKIAEHRYDQARTEVEAMMVASGDLQKVHVPGVGKLNWSYGTRRTFDKDRLMMEHPEIDFTPYFQTEETRAFRFTPDSGRR